MTIYAGAVCVAEITWPMHIICNGGGMELQILLIDGYFTAHLFSICRNVFGLLSYSNDKDNVRLVQPLHLPLEYNKMNRHFTRNLFL